MLGTLAGRIDAWVIAEGIERHAELSAIVRAGVPLGQGYHLGRPAPGMAGIDAGLAARLRAEQADRVRNGGVAPLLDRAPAVPEARAGTQAAGVMLADPRVETIVALDARERPVGMLRRDDPGRRGVRPVMVVGLADAAADVARRAMSRPPWRRFDPVVCCDGRGRYAGIVTLERLIADLSA
jgi:CBS domain